MADDESTSSSAGQSVEAVAAKTAEAAKRAGARGPGHRGDLTKLQLALRDTAIVAALHAGEDSKAVAKEWGITRRSVQRTAESFAARRTALDDRPMEIIERLLRTYEQQLADFSRMMVAHAERTPAVAIAAMKGYTDTLERYTLLLSDIGKLPDNLELFRSETEMIRTGEVMLAKVKQLEDGELSAFELGEFFRGLMTARVPVWELAPDQVHELPAGDRTESE